MTRWAKWTWVLLGIVAVASLSTCTSCSSPIPRRDPTGERFPSVVGNALDGTETRIPEDFAGERALLFVGYVMESQFDIDRWLIGVHELGLDVAVYEVPTIDGLVPGMISGVIDDGMREGIPQEDWAIVVTVYDDADRITEFTGTESPRNARVVLLDEEGVVRFFHDRGYSLGSVVRLREVMAGE